MSRFFNTTTRVLHSVQSYSGAVQFANSGAQGIKVIETDEINPPTIPRLRRQNAGYHGMQFYSTEDGQLHGGNYDKKDSTNSDLIEVAATAIYR